MLPEWNDQQTWFHGSPYPLQILLPGSTITPDKDLARAFSHKPQVVSLEEGLQESAMILPRIRHNGIEKGLLYIVDETIYPEDIYPHPTSSMPPGLEWLTRRPMKLHLIGPVTIEPGEWLSDADVRELLGRGDPSTGGG